jgi:hypothetical protein
VTSKSEHGTAATVAAAGNTEDQYQHKRDIGETEAYASSLAHHLKVELSPYNTPH